jgi:hypothetical protein
MIYTLRKFGAFLDIHHLTRLRELFLSTSEGIFSKQRAFASAAGVIVH